VATRLASALPIFFSGRLEKKKRGFKIGFTGRKGGGGREEGKLDGVGGGKGGFVSDMACVTVPLKSPGATTALWGRSAPEMAQCARMVSLVWLDVAGCGHDEYRKGFFFKLNPLSCPVFAHNHLHAINAVVPPQFCFPASLASPLIILARHSSALPRSKQS